MSDPRTRPLPAGAGPPAQRAGSGQPRRADAPPREAPAPADQVLDRAAVEHLLFDHISDAVFATDPTNRVTHWTASAERLFGYTAAEAVGRPFGALLPYRMARPEDEPGFVADLAAGRTWRGTGTVRLRDGHEIWLESTVQPILAEGRLLGSVSVSRDVSATVAAQRELAARERFVDAVLDLAATLVVVRDAAGRVVRFNRACERLSGYAAAEILGRPLDERLVPPAEIEPERAALARVGVDTVPLAYENHWVTRAGERRLLSWEATGLADAQGALSHIIATGIDMTDARRDDEALHGIEAVGRLLAVSGPLPEALDAVLGELQARMGYPFLALYLRDGEGLRLGAQRGYRALPERLDAGVGIMGRVCRGASAALVPDVAADPDYVPGAPNVAAELAAPLLGDAGTLGVLNIEVQQGGRLTSRDLRLAQAVAERLASALLRHREQAALRDRVRLLAALADFSAAANAILDPARLASALGDAVGAVVTCDLLIVATREGADGRQHVRAVRGADAAALGALIEPGDGPTGRAVAERAVIAVERLPRAGFPATLRDHVPYEETALMAVPLVREDIVLGVIAVGRAGPAASFSPAEREVLALLGAEAALALANAQLVAEVSELAIHDGLTGLSNRRHFDAELEHAIARNRRRGPPGTLAAIMFDLDHFGAFNRQYGHLAGDAMLRLFGGILRERLRSADLVARYGGEEFVAILEDCSLPEAVGVAETIRQALAARTVPGPDGAPLRATVSAGCALLDPALPTREALIGRADAGLFRAKRAGRNQVVAA